MRELTDSFEELDKIEEKVRESLEQAAGVSEKDREFQFARMVEDELRKHGA